MTIVYPKEGKQDFSFHKIDDAQVVDVGTELINTSMCDDVVLHVNHVTGIGAFNYTCEFKGTTHHFHTNIDTNFHSSDLKILIDACIKYENIWF